MVKSTDTGEASWIPALDMVFESDEKAYEFYCLYSRETGFAVRKHLVKRRSSDAVYSRVFACYCEGFTREKILRADARIGCEAHLTVKVMDDGRFCVSEFEAALNHELATKSKDAIIEYIVPSLTIRDETPLIIGRPMGASDSDIPLQPEEACTPSESWVSKLDMEFRTMKFELYKHHPHRPSQLLLSPPPQPPGQFPASPASAQHRFVPCVAMQYLHSHCTRPLREQLYWPTVVVDRVTLCTGGAPNWEELDVSRETLGDDIDHGEVSFE